VRCSPPARGRTVRKYGPPEPTRPDPRSLGIAATGALAACSGSEPTSPAKTFGTAKAAATTGQRVTTTDLVAKQTTLDLGGPEVATWVHGNREPVGCP
jgi:hypothetical protein